MGVTSFVLLWANQARPSGQAQVYTIQSWKEELCKQKMQHICSIICYNKNNNETLERHCD